ncbi:MAG: response regulator [Cyclobacteriaceae bacterium]|nr:response regulator [Cyclobacteriaceae bacterium]
MVKAVSGVKNVDCVVWVPSGEEALCVYRTLNPDLIMMDIVQKGMTGIESARTIREQDGKVRIVLVSESFNLEFLIVAHESKLDGYLVRTYDPNVLKHVLEDVGRGQFLLFSD